ncbi:hypothetical protein [Piscirickettsia salmonis]|uniref:hypothetical protein n=1 Tax=Piscirickettsia salmonis TaxID=1238 RepID=UPI001E2FD2C0|nr:hypothetical protein [Piscirickettsia salmonis]
MLGDFASLDVQNTYRGSDAYAHLGETSGLMDTIFGSQKEVSMQISSHYENVAEFFKIAYLDTATFISAAPGEGVHLLAEENIKLGRAVAEKVKGILIV